jgi:hypothetical protein
MNHNEEYINFFTSDIEKIGKKISYYNNNAKELLMNNITISKNINKEFNLSYKNIHDNFAILHNILNKFLSFILQINSLSDIMSKMKQNIDFYENKLLFNNRLLKKNITLIAFFDNLLKYYNYSDFIDIKKLKDNDFDILENNEKIFFYDTQNNTEHIYYDKFKEYLEKINIENLINNSNKLEYEYFDNLDIDISFNDNIDFELDKDINLTKQLINNIKKKASRNKYILEEYNKQISYNIKINKELYDYLYSFPINFKYFNINNNFLQDNIPKLNINHSDIHCDIHCDIKIYFEKIDKKYDEFLNTSHHSTSNFTSIIFELSKLKSYFNFLDNFFNIDNLYTIINKNEDKSIISQLIDIYKKANKNFDFINYQTICLNTIENINNFIEINKNFIQVSYPNFLQSKNLFYQNNINKLSLQNEYRSIIYRFLHFLINDNNFHHFNNKLIDEIFHNQTYIYKYNFDNIRYYLTEKQTLYLSLIQRNDNKIIIENEIINLHEIFEKETNYLQYLISNIIYGKNEKIIEKNSNILDIEIEIVEKVEKVDIINNEIKIIMNDIDNNKTNILNEITNIIKYYL